MPTFQFIPNNVRVPGVYIELNNANANTATTNSLCIAVGQMSSAGTATPNVPVVVAGNYNQLFGYGSMLSIMCARFLNNNSATQLYALPLADNGSGTKGTQTTTFTGPATQTGTVNIYIAGNLVQFAVNVGDTATVMATNFAAAVNAINTLPVTATSAAGVVTTTCNNAGVAASDITMDYNYAGAQSNQVLPTGVGITFATNPGTANPILTTALSNLSSTLNCDFIIFPYTDSTSVSALTSFMSQTTGRWSWEQQAYGFAWSAYRGTVGQLTSYGVTNNSQFLSVFGVSSSVPNACYDVAAAVVAAVTPTVINSPALPIQNILVNVLPPLIKDQFDPIERNTLLYDGISTLKSNQAGQTFIDRAVTTYTTNAAGVPDSSFLQVETLYTSMYVQRFLINQLASIYAQYSLVPNGSQIQAGNNVTTAALILGTCNSLYQDLCDLNICVNQPQFSASATANDLGNGTVQLYLPCQYAGQLRVIEAQIAFSTPT